MNKLKLAVSFLLMAGCAGTLGEAWVNLKIVAPEQSTEVGNALSTQELLFSKALAVVSDIEFELAQNCNQNEDSEIEYEGAFIINLLTGTSTPELGQTKLASGQYCEIKFEIEALDDDITVQSELSSEMQDLSIFIQGTAENVSFELRYKEDQDFELESTNQEGFNIEEGVTNELLLRLNIYKLFDNVDFATLNQVNDVAIISNDINEDTYALIKENISTIADLFEEQAGVIAD